MIREIRNVYKAILFEPSKIMRINDFIEAYDEYNKYKRSVENNPIKRKVLTKIYFPVIKKPKYLQWVEKYLVKIKEQK